MSLESLKALEERKGIEGMITATNVTQWLIRATGVIQIVLGLLFWIGYAREFVPFHTVSGLVLVFALWAMAIIAAVSGVSLGMVLLTVLWGFLTIALGMGQDGLLVGQFHWVVQVLHLLFGMAAIGQGEALAARIKRARPLPE